MEACFHCGESCGEAATIATVAGAQHAVCCIGCRAAAEWISGLGLADYYRFRSEPTSRPDPASDFAVWDRPALQALHVRTHASDRAEIVFLVEGMRCAACGWLIERAIGGEDGVHEIGVNAPARRVRLTFDPSVARLSHLMARLALLGYTPQPLTAEALDSSRLREKRDALKRIVVAGLGAMQAMMYAVALYAGRFDGIDEPTRDFFRWLGFLVATPVVFYSARPFFGGAFRALRARQLSMDTPIALAIASIYGASLFQTIAHGREIYFDSVSMFVLFLLTARYVEMAVRHRTGDLVDALARLQPAVAERINASGSEQVAVHELVAGDRLRVGAGAIVPADGTLVAGLCRVDESLLSGESRPRVRACGEALIAGSLVLEGPIEMQVERVGAETALADIVRMVTRAASSRPAAMRDADRRVRGFVFRVLIVTLITAAAWYFIDPARAFDAALAVLVVRCPCAFALAAPAGLTRAIAVLARRGVLVVDPDALDALARADLFVFDKTGTLSRPQILAADVLARRGDAHAALVTSAALEQASAHPLALAIRAAVGAARLPDASVVRHIAGVGVSGIVGGIHYRLGSSAFAAGEDSGRDALVLADPAGVVAEIGVREQANPGAASALDALHDAGVATLILSGDAPGRVAAIANQLGVRRWIASMSPAAKLAEIEALRDAGAVVAMIGDGVNDAPVLAAADVGIALSSGTALAQAASGLVLTADRLDELPRAIDTARRMRAILKQNLNWALAYNLAAVPLAAFGFVPPWLAAIGMSASSLIVVLNALRIDTKSRPTPAARSALAEALA